MTRLTAILSLFLLCAPAAWVAAENEPVQPDVAALGPEPEPPPTFESPTVTPLVRISLAIAVISGIGWGLAWWARRRRISITGADTKIQLLATRSLGPRHQVALIEVGEHRLLVGMGGDSIATLAQLDVDPSFSEQLEQEMAPQSEEPKRELVDLIGRFEGLDG